MDTLFVNPFPDYAAGINEATIYPPLGLLYMASVLRENKHKTKVIDANMARIPNEKVLEIVAEDSPACVGISANIVTAKAAADLADMIRKEYPDILLVAGGPLPSIRPEYFLKHFDIVTIGEAENTMLEIAEKKPKAKIDGIAFMSGKKIVRTKPRELIEDLDSLPFPAYDLLTPHITTYKSRARRKPNIPIFTSRGCPFGCIFCNKSIFGYKFRARSPENIIKEIDWLVKEYGVKQLDILDDNLTLDINRADKLFDKMIERDYKLVINCQNGVRADRLTPELVRKMKKVGVFKVGIGIESGDPEILKKIKKDLDLEKVKEAIRMFRKEDIITYGFFIVGFPWDTEETMQRTIDFAKEANPHIANFMIAVPLPGTELYDHVEASGRFLRDVDQGICGGFYEGGVFFKPESISAEKVSEYYKKAYKKFYLRPGKMLDVALTFKSMTEVKWTVEAALGLGI